MKFFRRGISKVIFVPTTPGATPSIATLNSTGTDLSPHISEMSGWQLVNTPIRIPNLATKFTPQVEGEDTVGDSTLTFLDEDDTGGADFRVALPKGTAGFFVFAPYGLITGKRSEVWEIRCTGINDQYTVGNEAARTVGSFAILSVPDQDATLAA